MLERCFVPKAEVMRKYEGTPRLVTLILLQGYVFMLSRNGSELARQLKALSFPVRLVGEQETTYIPLSTHEQQWFSAVLDSTSTMRFSRGYIEQGQTYVTEGPLRGFEQRIRKIDRHKKLAYIDIDMIEQRTTVRAGLEITRKT